MRPRGRFLTAAVAGGVRASFGVAALGAMIVGAGCSKNGEATVSILTSEIPTTYLTLPIPSTTVAPATPAGGPQDEAPPGTAPAGPTPEQAYTVERGDYLMRIASNFGVTPEAIVAYNGWEGLEHALNPGDAIRIPPSDYDPNATTAPSPSAAPAGSDGPACADGTQQERYTISAGDTRGRVAARFDVTVDELDAANAGTEFYDAFVLGVEIVIPC